MSEVKFLSLDELEQLGGFSLLQSYRRTGKPLLEADALMKVAKAWGERQGPKRFLYSENPAINEMFDFVDPHREHRLLNGTITGSFTITEPNPSLRRFLEINQYGKLPGFDTLEVGTSYRTMVKGEWEPVYNVKPKNTYKPHSFQPAKGEAPTSCKPNPKTVAKNRAKRKLKKK